jgi:hypothetical protein
MGLLGTRSRLEHLIAHRFCSKWFPFRTVSSAKKIWKSKTYSAIVAASNFILQVDVNITDMDHFDGRLPTDRAVWLVGLWFGKGNCEVGYGRNITKSENDIAEQS